INARLKLVAKLKGYKESRGMSFVDPEREEWMLQYLSRANRGPLSPEGLREILESILDLTKREVERGSESSSPDASANSSGVTCHRNYLNSETIPSSFTSSAS